MKKVFFQGTFDGINAGHSRVIQHLAEMGKLVIGLNSDSLVNWMIGAGPKNQDKLILPFKERKEILSLGYPTYISEIIECDEPSALRYLQRLKADIYALTREWEKAQKDAIDWMKIEGGEIIFTERYPDVMCNTDIRERIKGTK